MGLFSSIKAWLNLPLTPNANLKNLTLYIGIIFIIAWLWSSVVRGISEVIRKGNVIA